MSGYLGDLSPEQERTLKEFKENISDVLTDDYNDRILLQFLRARRFDLTKTEIMFRKHVEWRKGFPKKYMLEEYKIPDILWKYLPVYLLGHDKEGSTVRIFLCGAYDVKGLTSIFRIHERFQYSVHILEKDRQAMDECSKKYNRHPEGETWIFDLGGLKVRTLLYKPVYNYLVSLLKLYEANYPENLKAAYVIRIPYFFSLILNVLKSIADERTMNKIHIFGEDGWKEELLKHMDAEILPDWLGHPDYASMLNIPAKIPEKYYMKNQNKLQKDTESVQEICLKRRSREVMPLYVDDVDCTIIWSVECCDGDINLGLFYSNKKFSSDEFNENELEEIIPFSKAGGDYGPVSGSYVNKKTGVYALVFDNTFSFMRSKNVLYTFDVTPPHLMKDNTKIEDITKSHVFEQS